MKEVFYTNKTLKNGILTVEFTGPINEDCDFFDIIDNEVKRYIFDMGGVNFINSCGIREWVRFTDRLKAPVTYINCPQVVVKQFNMVHGLVGENNFVESFYAPYYCEVCDEEKPVLLPTEKVEHLLAPTVNCDIHHIPMEFDDIEAKYFRFLKGRKIKKSA